MQQSAQYRLELREVGKRFGSVVALESVSFGVRPGEVVGLLGDNGAGKSTTVKIVTGYHRPSSGELYWEGRPVAIHSPEQARAIGIQTVYQDLALVDSLSIARNFFLGAEPVRRWGPFHLLAIREMQQRTSLMLREIGIKDLNPATPVGALSGGERQAVAIGRSYYFGGQLLILDEPTAALSVKQTRKVFELVAELKARGTSVLVIEHNMFHAHQICDRLIVIRQGRVFGDYRKEDLSVLQLEEILAGAELGSPAPAWS
jgi:simple sugar transport system ATP-binding protein